MIRTASCSCGQLKAVSKGEPAWISVCHCLDCKRRSGSAFACGATFEAGEIETEGESRTYNRSSDEGFWARMSFCPDCGNTVFYEIERRPGMITIPIGAYADPAFPEPTVSVFDERRHEWIQLRTSAPLVYE